MQKLTVCVCLYICVRAMAIIKDYIYMDEQQFKVAPLSYQ
jgi:hypothetical protein